MKLRPLLLPALFLVLGTLLAVGGPVRGAAAAEMDPGCTEATIAALSTCVAHADAMGAITNQGVYTSLQSELTAAQAAAARGQVVAAVRLLTAFIAEVQAQAGITIEATHAAHMIQHAELVIAALQP